MKHEIRVVDSHTGGEPTRVVMAGGPDLGTGPLSERVIRFRESFDDFRSAIVCEPRGSDVLVGALIVDPDDSTCDAGVIFFNNVGYLGMCGHGMIGVVETLKGCVADLPKQCRIETPVGIVRTEINDDGSVSIQNVPSYRAAKHVSIVVEGIGRVVGDVAWGGNWFYLVREPALELSINNVRELQHSASQIRDAINQAGFPEVDHIEIFGDPIDANSDSRNFVLCPGLEYDRSPCGTGTSAKLACLAADGTLPPGQVWRQEGILGSVFAGTYDWEDEQKKAILPTITAAAHITSEATLKLNSNDPFRWGIRQS